MCAASRTDRVRSPVIAQRRLYTSVRSTRKTLSEPRQNDVRLQWPPRWRFPAAGPRIARPTGVLIPRSVAVLASGTRRHDARNLPAERTSLSTGGCWRGQSSLGSSGDGESNSVPRRIGRSAAYAG